MRRNLLLVIVLGFLGFLNTSFIECVLMPPNDSYHIVIDAGHGGKDPGCLGKFSKEKDVALKVALQVQKLFALNDKDITISLTRSTDVFVQLKERANIANRKKADLFVSIHCNANPNKTKIGTETYAMGTHKGDDNLDVMMNENAAVLHEDNYKENYDGFDPHSDEAAVFFMLYQTAYLKQSLGLANMIENQLEVLTKRKSRGVKQAGLLVLWKTTMPAVLCEIGFLTTPQEERYLNSVEGQKNIANGIYKAIKKYKENTK